MATTLYSDNISTYSPSRATHRFSTEPGLLLLLPTRSIKTLRPYLTIPSGTYALVSRRGATQDFIDKRTNQRSPVWPPGLHFVPPTVNISALVTQQTIVYQTPAVACKTKDNVTVNMIVKVAFRIMGDVSAGEDPELVRKFVCELKPSGLEVQLRDAMGETVRTLMRSLTHKEVYGIRETLGSVISVIHGDGEKRCIDETCVDESDSGDREATRGVPAGGMDVSEYMKERLNTQFMPQGVQILSIIIQSCTLPPDISNKMEEKTKEIYLNAQQRIYHQNNMQNTHMEEEIATLMQTLEEQRVQEESSGKEMINEEKVKFDDVKAEAMKSQAAIIEEGAAKIQKLKAENALEVQRIQNRKDESIATIMLQAKREAANLYASTKLEVEKKIAVASVESAKNRAEASRLLARAEGITAPMLHHKNIHETKLKHIQVCKALADADNMIICDSDGNDTNVMAIADSILAESDNNNLSRSSVLAELALMNQVAKRMFENDRAHPVVHEAVNGHHGQIVNRHD